MTMIIEPEGAGVIFLTQWKMFEKPDLSWTAELPALSLIQFYFTRKSKKKRDWEVTIKWK